MLIQVTRATRHGNFYPIIDSRFNIILIVKLIQETNVFGIQSSYGNLKSSEFVDLFAKGSAIKNTGVLFNNYKKCSKDN